MSFDLQKDIFGRYLSSFWKRQYERISSALPAQDDVHRTKIEVPSLVAAGNNLEIHIAPPLPAVL